MPKHSYLVAFLLFGSLICVAMWFFWNSPLPADTQTEQVSGYEVDTLVKNITWDTDFQTKIPFREGDEIQIAYVIKNLENTTRKVRADFSSLHPVLKDQTIALDSSGAELVLQDSFLYLEPNEVKTVYINGLTLTGSESLSGVIENASKKIFQTVQVAPVLENSTQNSSQASSNQWGSQSNSSTEQVFEIPKIWKIDQRRFQSYTDNVLVLQITHPENVDYVMIGEKWFKIISDGDKQYIFIPKETFASGEHLLSLLLKNGSLIPSSYLIQFEFSSDRISISNIAPSTFKNDIARFVVVQGNGLGKVVSVQLNNGLILKKTEFVPINDYVLAVKIPEGLDPGKYSFTVMDTANIYELTRVPFTIIQ